MRVLPNGVAVCGTTHHAEWCATEGLVHDSFMAGIVRDNISKGELFVNIGAHIGSLAKVAVEVGARVICFEPNPDAVLCLRHNLSNTSAGIFNVGISDKEGRATLNMLENSGASYLSGEDGDVVTLPLDAFDLPRVSTILADCEGYELHILRGAEQTINRFHPKLVIEINEGALARQGSSAEEISYWLSKHGYKWRALQSGITAASPQYDILCTWNQPAISDSTCVSSVVDWDQFEQDARFTNPPQNDSRESIVRDAVAVLKKLCTAPRYISQVRKELKAQGVIK